MKQSCATLLIAGILLCNPTGLLAQDGELALAVTTGVASRYVYRGVERSSATWQTGLEGAFDGWRGRLWSNLPSESAEPGELQSSLGYVWRTTSGMDVEARGTHFWYVDGPGNGAAAHSFEAAVHLDWNLPSGWRPGLGFAYDIRYRSRAVEASLAYDVALPDFGTYLELRAYGGQVAAEDVLPDTRVAATRDAYTYFGADLRLPYRIAVHWVLAAEAHLTGTINQNRAWSPMGRGAGSRGSLNLAVKFEM
ncbi:MAG: hypothetical protein ACOZE5_14460 [Verrucomicrobiota bacterium]